MRKSNNYYKFMEYVSYGKRCDDTICKDNGVLECTSYCTVSDIEYYENTTLGVENDWLTIKNVLVNEEVIYVYYVKGESTFYIDTFILDNFKTQKELKYAIHKAVDKFFINNVDIITETSEIEDFDEYEDIIENEDLDGIIENENLDETEETTTRDTIDTLPPHIYNDTDINPLCMKCQDENLLPYNCNDCNNKKLRKKSLYGMFGGFPTITEMYNNKCFCCPADRQGNRCGGEQWCKETWKRYEAITNPEWHHVSLATLANIDFDMLDKKRQVYLKAHRELKRTLADLSKCKTGHTYEARARKFMRDMISQYYDNEISYAMRKYLDLQLSMSNVVNGVWSSCVEPATGLYESRRYSRPTLTY